jgi:hypothetical protein
MANFVVWRRGDDSWRVSKAECGGVFRIGKLDLWLHRRDSQVPAPSCTFWHSNVRAYSYCDTLHQSLSGCLDLQRVHELKPCGSRYATPNNRGAPWIVIFRFLNADSLTRTPSPHQTHFPPPPALLPSPHRPHRSPHHRIHPRALRHRASQQRLTSAARGDLPYRASIDRCVEGGCTPMPALRPTGWTTDARPPPPPPPTMRGRVCGCGGDSDGRPQRLLQDIPRPFPLSVSLFRVPAFAPARLPPPPPSSPPLPLQDIARASSPLQPPLAARVSAV